MSIQLLHHAKAAVRQDGAIARRDFIKGISTAVLAAGGVACGGLMSLQAAALRKRGMACIVLWMGGGPSQFETFSPLDKHENGGDTQSIATAVPGIRIAANFPEVAKIAGDIAIIRSMTSKEGNHNRAS